MSYQVEEEVHGLVFVRRVRVEPPLSHHRARGLVQHDYVEAAASIVLAVLQNLEFQYIYIYMNTPRP
jgi:hypothetical protein